MQFLMDNWMLIVVAVISGAMLMWPAMSGGSAQSLSPNQAVQLMNHDKAVVIDVCEPSEFAGGHIGAARNLPLALLDKQLEATVKDKSLPVIMVCASGMRSKRAVAAAQKLGYARAYSLTGGMAAWRGASMPVSKA